MFLALVVGAICVAILKYARDYDDYSPGGRVLRVLMGPRPEPEPVPFGPKRYVLSIVLALVLGVLWNVHFVLAENPNEVMRGSGFILLGALPWVMPPLSLFHTAALQRLPNAGVLPSVALAVLFSFLTVIPFKQMFDWLPLYAVLYGVIVGWPLSNRSYRHQRDTGNGNYSHESHKDDK